MCSPRNTFPKEGKIGVPRLVRPRPNVPDLGEGGNILQAGTNRFGT